jgi:hypothetical protein
MHTSDASMHHGYRNSSCGGCVESPGRVCHSPSNSASTCNVAHQTPHVNQYYVSTSHRAVRLSTVVRVRQGGRGDSHSQTPPHTDHTTPHEKHLVEARVRPPDAENDDANRDDVRHGLQRCIVHLYKRNMPEYRREQPDTLVLSRTAATQHSK